MASVRVTKMSGAGNDFLLLGPNEAARLVDRPAWVRQVCRRGLSVGADGVLFVEPAGPGRVSVTFLNPDGTATFCGNGSRCAARFAHLEGLADNTMLLETAAGEVPAEVREDRVRLRLAAPRDRGAVEIDAEGERLAGRWVIAGVPHFILFVDEPAAAPLERWGPAARRHARFGPPGTNVDLAGYRSDGSLAIRTWERGVEGETLACGSGAVAAAHAARLAGGQREVRVLPAGGVPIEITLTGSAEAPGEVVMSGDARIIFRGELDDEATSGF